jgi:hypothetical protein
VGSYLEADVLIAFAFKLDPSVAVGISNYHVEAIRRMPTQDLKTFPYRIYMAALRCRRHRRLIVSENNNPGSLPSTFVEFPIRRSSAPANQGIAKRIKSGDIGEERSVIAVEYQR